MAVINVLYLPSDDRLRSLVRLVLEFVEEVYRGEFLAGIRFVAFDPDNETDVERVKNIAGRERFVHEVRHARCRFEVVLPSFVLPHSNLDVGYTWIPISSEEREAPLILETVAHELTHQVLHRLPADHREPLARAFLNGTNLDKSLARFRAVPRWLIAEVGSTIDEFAVIYIVDNYFRGLRRGPETPTNMTKIGSVVIAKILMFMSKPLEPEHFVAILATAYRRLVSTDLPEFRRAVHETFMKTVERLPADVLESNRAKYEILYRRAPVT
jgi:hypothetical protein